jgi:ABC-type histidine transport system ATPase subunit
MATLDLMDVQKSFGATKVLHGVDLHVADGEMIVIVGASRTPVGSFGVAFGAVPAHELGATAIKAALERAKVSPDDVD